MSPTRDNINQFDMVFYKQIEDLKSKSREYEDKMRDLHKHRKYLQKEFGIGKENMISDRTTNSKSTC